MLLMVELQVDNSMGRFLCYKPTNRIAIFHPDTELTKDQEQYVVKKYYGCEIMVNCQTYKDLQGNLFVPLFHLTHKLKEEYNYVC